MFTSSVIVVLREVLESATLLSILLIIATTNQAGMRWILKAILTGLIGAAILAINLRSISSWLDYTGQEVTNAGLQICIFILLTVLIQRYRNATITELVNIVVNSIHTRPQAALLSSNHDYVYQFSYCGFARSARISNTTFDFTDHRHNKSGRYALDSESHPYWPDRCSNISY